MGEGAGTPAALAAVALAGLPGPDEGAWAAVAARAAQVLRPAGAFARLDAAAAWLADWQRPAQPAVTEPVLVVFVADHGVAGAGVSAYPPAVTGEMLAALRTGRATANALATAVGARVEVVDVGTGRPTMDLTRAPALPEAAFAACVAAGRDAVAALGPGPDLLVLGEMGIANTTAAAAVAASLLGGPSAGWVGPGTGVTGEALGPRWRPWTGPGPAWPPRPGPPRTPGRCSARWGGPSWPPWPAPPSRPATGRSRWCWTATW